MTVTDVVDAFHRLAPDVFAISEKSLKSEPHPRVHALRAGFAAGFALPVSATVELAAARALGPDPMDASLINALEIFLHRSPGAAAPALIEHCEAFPDDTIAMAFRAGAITSNGEPGAVEHAMALIEASQDRLSDNWRYQGALSYVRVEQCRFDEARALAEDALRQEPRAAHAVHALAHVNYETGAHVDGLRWLDEWRRAHPISYYQQHFAWHTSLHLLAQGDIPAARRRYDECIRPATVLDAGTFLWRCRLAGIKDAPAGHAAMTAAQPVYDALPWYFLVFNATFAMAAAEDVAALALLAERLAVDSRSVCRDVIVPVIQAQIASLEDRPHDVVDILTPQMDGLRRLGGSHAQREVVEDTLVYALVDAGESDRARALLEARLRRRPHALDSRLLARTAGA